MESVIVQSANAFMVGSRLRFSSSTFSGPVHRSILLSGSKPALGQTTATFHRMTKQARIATNVLQGPTSASSRTSQAGPSGSPLTGNLKALFDVVNEQDLTGIKFFSISRLEPTLVKQVTEFPNKQVCCLDEMSLEESSADIAVFLTTDLAQCPTMLPQL
jgi:hypothetical protein